MAIISTLESRTIKGRLTLATIIIVLTLGGVTMLYPFGVMVSGALRSEMDENELSLLPRYLVDDAALYRKFIETKYNQDTAVLNRSHLRTNFSFRDASAPRQVSQQAIDDLQQFWTDANPPQHWQALGGIKGSRTVPERLTELRSRLAEQYGGDIAAFSRDTGIIVGRWKEIGLEPPAWHSTRYEARSDGLQRAYVSLVNDSPLAERQIVNLSGAYLETMVFPRFGQSVSAYNAANGTALGSFGDFVLPRRIPDRDAESWIRFVRTELNPSFVQVDPQYAPQWTAFLFDKYDGRIGNLNQTWHTKHASFDAIALPSGQWLAGVQRQDYQQFLVGLPPQSYQLFGPEFAWRDWLTKKYGRVPPDLVHLPVDQLEYQHATTHSASLRWTYATRNFSIVLRELFTQGRVFSNTLIFCGLAVGTALLVNPLAAYALSRLQLPGGQKLLLLLILTMAFPAAVTLVPTFVMLREMGMLNTFLALLLPTAANGYLVFLVKGFFDSLPKEIFEAAQIDGASEVRIFFQFALALSKPALAVVALMTFNQAYLTFLFAIVVCPSPDMWIISVWLYQWQSNASISLMFASVLIACIPTLAVFLVAQNVIMNGLAVPSEK